MIFYIKNEKVFLSHSIYDKTSSESMTSANVTSDGFKVLRYLTISSPPSINLLSNQIPFSRNVKFLNLNPLEL